MVPFLDPLGGLGKKMFKARRGFKHGQVVSSLVLPHESGIAFIRIEIRPDRYVPKLIFLVGA